VSEEVRMEENGWEWKRESECARGGEWRSLRKIIMNNE